ncbi:stage III sporulation protein SpoIIIAB [Paenibacillus sp. 481]|uniref:stage III sporulation protein SpoIIIAB n=1 Tax=Paenibacillus sp. 481 TaxID=2835869 RepID=UPI001E3D1981|nr:stage III sporulation protein SpoIIIAB [Paenibacillus sp. 481]UHA72870.1 stage III sporulation protein AB [Paenibacillus sp. 481]
MIKLIGATLIIAAAASMGWMKSASYAARPQQLRQMNNALQRLETAIVYGHTPLSAAFTDIGRQLRPPLQLLFHAAAKAIESSAAVPRTAREAWHDALKQYGSATALKAEDLRVLVELGYSLGVSDRDEQKKHIRHAIKQLEQEEYTAREEFQRYGTMCRSLGVLCGVLAVILMY